MRVPSDPAVRLDDLSDIERHIIDTLRNIRFGALEIVVHDTRIVQIEKSEKTRFDPKGNPLKQSLS